MQEKASNEVVRLRPGTSLYENFLSDQLAFFVELATVSSSPARVKVGPLTFSVVYDGPTAYDILTKKSQHFEKAGQLRRLGGILGEGLLTSEGELHRKQKRLMLPLFQKHRLERYVPDILAAVDVMEDRWRSSPDIEMDIESEMAALTLDAIGRALFGTSFTELAAPMGELLADLTLHYVPGSATGGDGPVDGPEDRDTRIARNTALLEASLGALVEERRSSDQAKAERKDFLQVVCDLQDADGSTMSVRQIRDEMITLAVAGHETTSTWLSWALLMLTRHPEEAVRIRMELESISKLELAEPHSLRKTQAFLLETLRLYPPVWNISRKALAPLSIGDAQFSEGDAVYICTYLLHRFPEFGAEAQIFSPARWNDLSPAELGKQGLFLPFGAGPRSCIGEGFAYREALLIFSRLARDWHFHGDPTRPVHAQALTTLKAREGIRLRVSERRS